MSPGRLYCTSVGIYLLIVVISFEQICFRKIKMVSALKLHFPHSVGWNYFILQPLQQIFFFSFCFSIIILMSMIVKFNFGFKPNFTFTTVKLNAFFLDLFCNWNTLGTLGILVNGSLIF